MTASKTAMKAAAPTRTAGARTELPTFQMKPTPIVVSAITAGMTVIVRSDWGASHGIVSTPGIIMIMIHTGSTMKAALRHLVTATASPNSISSPENISSIRARGMLCRPFGSPSK